MPDITSLEMLLRSLIVALPLLVFTVLFFLLAARRRRVDAPSPRAHTLPHPATAQDQAAAEIPAAPASHSAAQGNAPAAPQPSRQHMMSDGALLLSQAPHQAEAAARSTGAPDQQVSPADTAAARIAKLEADIERAEEAGATVELAELYLALGRAHMTDGAEGEALSALRSAAGLAALHRAPKVQALARLDLAEVAMSHGDPITACEHWQMARMAFLDAGDRVEGEKIDRRMRGQGCPTDWVLTDF